MPKLAGNFLRLCSTFFYFLEFLCAGVGLAVYSYFLAKLSYHDRIIKTEWKAVEGLTGAAVLYTIFAVLLTCFLGGNRFFAILGIILDLAFCGAFIAVAVLVKDGASTCMGFVKTPLGNGLGRTQGAGTTLNLACRLNTAVLATAIAAALLFLVSLILQVFIMRHHQAEKKYGPSPANNYTSGSGSRFWKRKPKTTHDAYGTAEMTPAGTAGGFTGTSETGTGYTGTTGDQNNTYYNGYNKQDTFAAPQTGPYHTQPTGTAVNY